ncbi:MAG TPA: DNA methyltransferase, partial [Candidatus Kapabacteria bacterium]|nr:DNA methyltransferase [Candidatus Kapabacteria bacterium]
QPSCSCNAATIPCTILDPFGGAGTTGVVALKHGRKYIGIELKQEYLELARKRMKSISQQMAMEA